ncbi:hypothetical protein P7K49_015404 [Saguinus oedipus]|uniref:Retinoid-binding protein 7 n=1 Tax=Saguinus oedipus TaxID=9490 RepID=A0ABQ9V971_SAGOE|nr:hypothetical protein P7K49_015404 [Saguinus oedipus]
MPYDAPVELWVKAHTSPEAFQLYWKAANADTHYTSYQKAANADTHYTSRQKADTHCASHQKPQAMSRSHRGSGIPLSQRLPNRREKKGNLSLHKEENRFLAANNIEVVQETLTVTRSDFENSCQILRFCTSSIDFATRKIAKLLKPQKVIEQNGDSFTIHTNSSLRNYVVKFKVGEEFEEDNKGLDNRKCKSLVIWNNDRLTCVQKGEKKNRGWTHWIEGDKLYLVFATFCSYF